jgi:pimeloyl-ACP methyl ester carboxylesterase
VIALLAAAERPEAVRSLTVSESGAPRLAEGTPVVDEMIANGVRLFGEGAAKLSKEEFPRLFRFGAGSSRATPGALPDELVRGVELLKRERPPWEADIPLERLAAADFPVLIPSGGHSAAFEAVCDALAGALSPSET